MEQKRVLWIVAAVGLFLSVTIGTALIVYRPAKNQTPVLNPQLSSSTWTREASAPAAVPEQAAAPVQTIQPDVAQNTVPQAAVPAGDNPTQITNLTVISANTNVISDGTKTIDLNALTGNAPAAEVPAETVPAVPAPVQPVSAVASAEITVKTVTSHAETTTSTTTATNTPAPVTETSATSDKSAKTASSSVKTTSARIPDQYWVQAASFTKKVNAEEARDALAAEKIPGEVFTWKDANGVVYYRLRVGPYTTKSEADFWLSRIKEIGAFSATSSYVVNSSEKAAD